MTVKKQPDDLSRIQIPEGAAPISTRKIGGKRILEGWRLTLHGGNMSSEAFYTRETKLVLMQIEFYPNNLWGKMQQLMRRLYFRFKKTKGGENE